MVLGLESKIPLAHDDDLGVHEHGLVADAVDVVLDELELFFGFCGSGRGVRLHVSIISTQKIKSIIAIPLHPCSVSMPSTCATTTMSVHHTEFKRKVGPQPHCIANLITELFLDHYQELLNTLIMDSLKSIQDEFYEGQNTQELDKMRGVLSESSRTTRLAIFFFLLNVDQGIKKRVTSLELVENHPKLTRFFLDLKRILVPDFFTNETEPVSYFVDRCEEFYVLA